MSIRADMFASILASLRAIDAPEYNLRYTGCDAVAPNVLVSDISNHPRMYLVDAGSDTLEVTGPDKLRYACTLTIGCVDTVNSEEEAIASCGDMLADLRYLMRNPGQVDGHIVKITELNTESVRLIDDNQGVTGASVRIGCRVRYWCSIGGF